jgi:hypothetical protein
MPNTVHLIGGGPGALRATARHLRAIVSSAKSSPKARPLVAYVGAASGDNLAFMKMLSAGLKLSGARVEPARTVGKKASASTARQLLSDCDLVFMSGGDVSAGMEVLHDRDLVTSLRDLAKAGKRMFGISAGSLMLAREWVRFPDDDEARAELFECLAIAPVHVDAHSEDDGWSELRTLLRLRHQRGDQKPIAYGLVRPGCLRLELDGEKAKLAALGAPIPRLAVKRGAVVDDGALAPE